jgi:polysaccharide pyruvyl transferase WcaK-like protein
MKNIFLIGSYGRGNAGDDALLLSAFSLFGENIKYINATSNAHLPKGLPGAVQVLETSFRSGFFRKLRAIKNSDNFIYYGGDLWVELYEDRFQRIALYKMLLVNILLKLLGKNVHYIGVGAGDIKGYSLWLARKSASIASTVVIRDERSLGTMNVEHAFVLPDATIMLSDFDKPSTAKNQKLHIGVSVLYYVPEPEKNFQKYLANIADMVNSLDPDKVEVTLMAFYSSDDVNDDNRVCEQLTQLINEKMSVKTVTGGLEHILGAMKGIDLCVATRLHAAIFSVYLGVPTVGIAYRKKVSEFFKRNGLSESCVDLTSKSLETVVKRTIMNLGESKASVMKARERNLEWRSAYQKLSQ